MMAQWIIHTQEQQCGAQFRPPSDGLEGERGKRAAPGQIQADQTHPDRMRGDLHLSVGQRLPGDSLPRLKRGKSSRSQGNGEAPDAD